MYVESPAFHCGMSGMPKIHDVIRGTFSGLIV